MSGISEEKVVLFVMPNEGFAKEFLLWMQNEGEQVYWDAMEMTERPMVTFNYHMDILGVTCSPMEPED